MLFQEEGNDADDVRAGEAVAGEVSIAAVEPRGPYIYAGSGQLNDLAKVKTEVQRIGLFALYHRNEGRRKHRWKARMRKIIGGGDNYTARLIRTV